MNPIVLHDINHFLIQKRLTGGPVQGFIISETVRRSAKRSSFFGLVPLDKSVLGASAIIFA